MRKADVTGLRVQRALKRITQHEAAAALGIHRDRYWRIEHGYTDPTDAERSALSALFGVPASELFPAAGEVHVSEPTASDGARKVDL